MGKIKKLNQNNEDLYPVTLEDAVFDTEGVNIGTKIQDIKDNMIQVEDFGETENIEFNYVTKEYVDSEIIIKSTQTVNARYFGVTYEDDDETEALQRAFDYSNECKATILIEGNINVKGVLIIPEYLSLKGAAPHTTHSSAAHPSSISFVGNNNSILMTNYKEYASGIILEDILFKYDTYIFSSIPDDVSLFGNCKLTLASKISNCIFSGFTNLFYDVNFFAIARIEHITVYNCGVIFNNTRCVDVFIDDCYFSGPGKYPNIEKENKYEFGSFVNNCHFAMMKLTGCWFEFLRNIPAESTDKCLISNCIFDYCYDIYGTSYCMLSNNIFVHCNYTSIYNILLTRCDNDESLIALNKNEFINIINIEGQHPLINNNFFSDADNSYTNNFYLYGGAFNEETGLAANLRSVIIKDNYGTCPLNIKYPENINFNHIKNNINSTNIIENITTKHDLILPPDSHLDGYVYLYKQQKIRVDRQLKHTVSLNSNNVPIGFSKSIIENFNYWDFDDTIIILNNREIKMVGTGSWKIVYSNFIDLEQNTWYKLSSYTDSDSGSLQEVYLYDVNDNKIRTIYDHNSYFMVKDDEVKLKIAFRTIASAGEEVIFKLPSLCKFDGCSMNTDIVFDENGDTYRKWVDVINNTVIYESFYID